MAKISVIIPVYNTEKFLKKSIESVLNQTYKGLEIIIVNDGSTDNSRIIIEEYAKKDDRIIVVNQENMGLSSARNKGLEISSGEFISFVDSDDWVATDIYEYSMKIFNEYNSDVFDFGVLFSYDDSLSINNQKNYEIKEYYGTDILINYLYRGQTEKTPFSVCRKIYKKNLFDDVEFPVGKINEDIITNYKLLENAKKLISSTKIGYFYNQIGNSITRGGLKSKDLDLLDVSEQLVNLTKRENNKELSYLAEIKFYRGYFSLLSKIAYYGISDEALNKKEIINNLTKKLRQEYTFLIKSPMQFNRKIILTLLVIDIRLVSIPIKIIKFVRGSKNGK